MAQIPLLPFLLGLADVANKEQAIQVLCEKEGFSTVQMLKKFISAQNDLYYQLPLPKADLFTINEAIQGVELSTSNPNSNTQQTPSPHQFSLLASPKASPQSGSLLSININTNDSQASQDDETPSEKEANVSNSTIRTYTLTATFDPALKGKKCTVQMDKAKLIGKGQHEVFEGTLIVHSTPERQIPVAVKKIKDKTTEMSTDKNQPPPSPVLGGMNISENKCTDEVHRLIKFFKTFAITEYPKEVLRIFGFVCHEEFDLVISERLECTLYDLLYKPQVQGLRAKLTMYDRLRIMIECAKSIDMLHHQFFAHRDIKSPNFLLNKSLSRVCVCDFGSIRMAKQNRTERSLSTMVKVQGGTLLWLSPERITKSKLDQDFKSDDEALQSDVFSLGIVLAETFWNEFPFSDLADVTQRLNNPTSPPYDFAKLPCVYKSITNLIQRCINIDASKRPKCHEIISTLQDALLRIDYAQELKCRIPANLFQAILTTPSSQPISSSPSKKNLTVSLPYISWLLEFNPDIYDDFAEVLQQDPFVKLVYRYMYKIANRKKMDLMFANKLYSQLFEHVKNKKGKASKHVLALCYTQGLGVKQNIEKANEIWSSVPMLSYSVTMLYNVWLKVQQKNSETAKHFATIRACAEDGNVDAMYYLACCYNKGYGTHVDSRCVSWLESAALAGHIAAQFELATNFKNGSSVFYPTKNEEKAYLLYSMAARMGHLEAMYLVGDCLENGIGAAVHKAAAIQAYKEAAAAGCSQAQFVLAQRYETGTEIVKQSLKKAMDWYEQAAILGHAEAKDKLLDLKTKAAASSTNFVGLDTIKLIVVGDASASKTAIAATFLDNKYPSKIPTSLAKTEGLSIVDGVSYKLVLYDSTGQEANDTERVKNYAGADLALFVFSLNDAASFDNVKSSYGPEVQLHCPSVPTVLIGHDTASGKKSADISEFKIESVKERVGALRYYEIAPNDPEKTKEMLDYVLRLVHRRRKVIKEKMMSNNAQNTASPAPEKKKGFFAKWFGGGGSGKK